MGGKVFASTLHKNKKGGVRYAALGENKNVTG
jgi:hypothetical protein